METKGLVTLILLSSYGIFGFVFWVIMLRIMEIKSEKINYLHIIPRPFFKFWKIIKNENQRSKKIKYLMIFWIQIGMILSWLIGFIFILN